MGDIGGWRRHYAAHRKRPLAADERLVRACVRGGCVSSDGVVRGSCLWPRSFRASSICCRGANLDRRTDIQKSEPLGSAAWCKILPCEPWILWARRLASLWNTRFSSRFLKRRAYGSLIAMRAAESARDGSCTSKGQKSKRQGHSETNPCEMENAINQANDYGRQKDRRRKPTVPEIGIEGGHIITGE